MKRRTLINLLAACALLVQGMAWAVAAPMLPQAATEQSMPCDESMPMDMSCCDALCACADLCAGYAAAITPSFFFPAPMRADFQAQSFTGLRLSVNHTQRLRPPIALQS